MDYPNDYLTEERFGEIFQIAQPDISSPPSLRAWLLDKAA